MSPLEILARARQCYRSGDPDGVEELCRLVLRDQPAHPKALYLLGAACDELGRPDEALVHFQKILELCPNSARAHHARGSLMQQRGNLDEAVHSFQEAVRLRPGLVPAQISLGMALQAQGKAQEAAGCFREVLRWRPNLLEVHLALGAILQAQGNLAEAGSCYLEALRLDPSCVAALNNLCAVSHAEQSRIQSLLARPGLPATDASRLHFALGALKDRAGAYDQAFHHFRQANTLRRRLFHETGSGFDPDVHHALIDQFIATCDAGYSQRLRGMGRTTERPVFIVGMPQSGTSLVEQILASHPDVFGAGELSDIDRLASGLPAQVAARPPDRGKSSKAATYPGCLARLDQNTAALLADQYLEKLTQLNVPALRVTDRMPLNFLHLGLIAALFPRARIVHCVRNPLDVCLSCYLQDSEMAFSCDLGELGQFYLEYQRLMAHWRKLLPLEFMEVVYEELVEDQEAVTRRLVAFCGLSWNDRCLAQVRQLLNKSSVGHWHHYAPHLGPLFDSLERSFEDPSLSFVSDGPICFFND